MAEKPDNMNPSRRGALSLLGVAAVAAAVPAFAATPKFAAAGFVAMWRRAGNSIYLDERGARPEFCICSAYRRGIRLPPQDELALYPTGENDDPAWHDAVIDYLRAESAARRP